MYKQPSWREAGWQRGMAAPCPGPGLAAPGGELSDRRWGASLPAATEDRSKGVLSVGTSKWIFIGSDCRCWHRWPFLSAVPAAPHGQRCPTYRWSWRWRELLSCSWPFQDMGMERRRGEKRESPLLAAGAELSMYRQREKGWGGGCCHTEAGDATEMKTSDSTQQMIKEDPVQT